MVRAAAVRPGRVGERGFGPRPQPAGMPAATAGGGPVPAAGGSARVSGAGVAAAEAVRAAGADGAGSRPAAAALAAMSERAPLEADAEPRADDRSAVLVVEDDPDIGSVLVRGLEAEGYRVVHVASGDQAIALAAGERFHAVILDVMLPGASGLEVCRALRSQGHKDPVIMLSARSSVADRVEGLAAGADDYVVKPFDFDELLSRLAVQRLRRVEADTHILTVGRLSLDLDVRVASWGEHRAVLTEREAELLALLMRNAGRPLSRAEIFEAMWAGQGGAAINVVDVYIGYLRRKLGGEGHAVTETPIRTIRGRGFLFATT